MTAPSTVAHRRPKAYRLTVDLAERIGWTFIEAFAASAAVAALAGNLNVDAVHAASIAGVAAIAALVKGLAASKIGRPGTAALLPAALDHTDIIDVQHHDAPPPPMSPVDISTRPAKPAAKRSPAKRQPPKRSPRSP